MKPTRTNDIDVVTFDSLSALFEYACKGEANTPYGAHEASRHLHDRANKFYNYMTLGDLESHLQRGNARVRDAIEAVRERIEGQIQPPERKRRKLRRRLEDGDELESEAWLRRDPQGWSGLTRVFREKTLVRIAVNSVTIHFESPENLVYRGAAAVVLADVLGSMGVAVEITTFWSVARLWDGNSSFVQELVVKQPDEPLNIEAVAEACAEVGFIRRITHAAVDRVVPKPANPGLGSVRKLPEPMRRGYDVLIDTDVRTLAGATEVVLAQLERTEQ